ncbi:fructuronate reductase [Actinoplanes campanulatus]|uniref:Mannitol-1-phosphate 5-dehydrogenase n=1 Tax=Actinoplanes campanulatus TaxID=113559 RepID=A0A7W5FIJ2_9ACTN|nr:mannitol dehydrogenase family protein [Actinoplanes campanulatus]MBB3099535.1 fructuronate reductase [Actinoplanes campanulatus]GGN42389.1 mannitol dehydrogenase [Actinoplanes campanulatus]GID39884.1 mannitol dehydrogenase [Actinoplanes campanulatus]
MAVTYRLGRGALPSLPEASRPAVSPGSVRAGIVHLGLGAFHRAHQAVFTEDAVAASGGDWGILGVAPRSRDILEKLREQDGLYSVLTVGGGADRARTIGILAGLGHAAGDPHGVVAAIADPGIRIVSMTVTEKAYRLDPAGRLLVDDDLRAQLTGQAPPVSVPALLARGLIRRRAAGGGPLTVLCCDNMQRNGARIRGLVEQALEVAGADLSAEVAFPSTMVDRIVPATSADHIRRAAAALGADDAAPVVAEPFTQWVIEDDFPGGRPDWAAAGAVLTGDVTPWETLKLRALNGVHSSAAYLGALAGRELIADSLELPGMTGLLRRLIVDDIAPTIAPPPGVTVTGYGESVLERFANRELGHRNLQVAMDGTQKLPYRLLDTITERRRAGTVPVWGALMVAAWMRFARGSADGGAPLPLDDPLAGLIRDALAAAPDTPAGVVGTLLGLDAVFGPELAGDDVLRAELLRWYGELDRHGVVATVKGLG